MEKGVRGKPGARREKSSKNGKLFRRRSFRFVGGFMNKIMRTLGTLSHFGGDMDDGRRETEDDDGGFRDGTPCTLLANSGKMLREEDPPGGPGDQRRIDSLGGRLRESFTARLPFPGNSSLFISERVSTNYYCFSRDVPGLC